jgi:hypothetical protein
MDFDLSDVCVVSSLGFDPWVLISRTNAFQSFVVQNRSSSLFWEAPLIPLFLPKKRVKSSCPQWAIHPSMNKISIALWQGSP